MMFARAMAAVGLDPSYGAYLDPIPAITLATVNVLSLFGLHRRLRGALVGHLAVFQQEVLAANGYREGEPCGAHRSRLCPAFSLPELVRAVGMTDRADVEALGATVVALEGGRVTQRGTLAGLAAQPATEYVARFCGKG